MNFGKTYVFGALAAFTIASGAAAQDCPTDLETVSKGQLTVAVTTFAPYSFMNEKNELSGVDGDIVKAAAERLCLEVETLVVDPAAAIQSVMAGRADLTVGDWYRTAERAAVMSFTTPLYLDSMGIISTTGTDTVEDLVGQTVGTVQGYLWVQDLEKLLGDDLQLYSSSVNLQQDLRSGRIKNAVDGAATAQLAVERGDLEGYQVSIAAPDDRIAASMQPAQVGFPMRKNAVNLLAALDVVLEDMKAEGMIVELLSSYGLSPEMADVGEPRLVE
jgi:polar amino acid transport system substrate-binding protein|tara:strand:- start:2660 stop:3481 length:822 start_codon:yes stop_codon:yes gene_type:complete